jgi:hypothetical protein
MEVLSPKPPLVRRNAEEPLKRKHNSGLSRTIYTDEGGQALIEKDRDRVWSEASEAGNFESFDVQDATPLDATR